MTRHEDMTTGANARRRLGRPARRAAATAAVLAAGALVVGCGSPGDSGAASATDPAPASASGGEPASLHATKAAHATGSLRAGDSARTDACASSDLKAKIGPNHPGAGQENFSLVLTNTSGQECTVRGFPGFAFLNGDGDQVSVNPERDGARGKTVELAPGESAWAPLSFTNPRMTGVPTVTPDTALITPPDQRTSLRVDWKGGQVTATGKASVPKIGALTPGTGT